ncbi:MAG: biopolymer transporter ExbD [Candidatus Goldbacteria bacterium]|nr:biopolymer transporter ExbD [Candidatus Goldiibacteriota bacterium]
MAVDSFDEEPMVEINIIPLVDVSLVLLIIFMVATPFMTQSRLSVTLPQAVTDEAKDKEYVTITIDKDANISVNEKNVYTPKEMEQVIAQKLMKVNEKIIIIKADLNIDHGTVIDALDVAKKANPKKIYFATQHKKEQLQ